MRLMTKQEIEKELEGWKDGITDEEYQSFLDFIGTPEYEYSLKINLYSMKSVIVYYFCKDILHEYIKIDY